MNKIFFLLFFLIFLTPFSFSQIPDDNSQNNVRVIIELKEPSLKKNLFQEKTQEQILQETEKIKDEVVSQIGEEKIKNDFGNYFSAIITDVEMQKLKENSDIKNIQIVNQRQLFLQDSVNIIDASLSWKIKFSGKNLTGLGETICLIDTGVDYTHPDLGGCYGNNNPSSNCKIIGGIDFCSDDVNCNSTDDNPIDVNGHGTHIAGIISANGTLNGVAPESKIIIIKAGNSAGGFYDDDLMAGIDWCVNNASKFNISIISMSLGAGLFDSYCETDPLAPYINNATAKNISVIIATGNSGNYTHIAGPACVKSAIAVSGSTKENQIIYNRNSITDLIAPGFLINSTNISGSYLVNSGTSMATPHVAGAFAIFLQFFKLQNSREPTPEEILSAFQLTGKIINDPTNGLNFSLIKVYSALDSIENQNPVVKLNFPENNSETISKDLTFNCTASDFQLSNLTFYLWNSTGLIYSEIRDEKNNSEKEEIFNFSNLIYGNYKWNCVAYDSVNKSFNSNNSLVVFEEKVELNSPVNDSFAQSSQQFSCSILCPNISEMMNVTFYLWNSTDAIYSLTKTISENQTSFDYTFDIDGNYEWNCVFFNKYSEDKIADSNFSFIYDKTAPTILSLEKKTKSTTAEINFVTDEETNFTIFYGIENFSYEDGSESFLTSHSILLDDLENSTKYIFALNIYDKAGNVLENYSGEFTTTAKSSTTNPPSDSSSSSSGSSSSSSTATTPPVVPPEEETPTINEIPAEEMREILGEEQLNSPEEISENSTNIFSPLTGFVTQKIGVKNLSIGTIFVLMIVSVIFIANYQKKKKISNIVEEKFKNLESLCQ